MYYWNKIAMASQWSSTGGPAHPSNGIVLGKLVSGGATPSMQTLVTTFDVTGTQVIASASQAFVALGTPGVATTNDCSALGLRSGRAAPPAAGCSIARTAFGFYWYQGAVVTDMSAVAINTTPVFTYRNRHFYAVDTSKVDTALMQLPPESCSAPLPSASPSPSSTTSPSFVHPSTIPSSSPSPSAVIDGVSPMSQEQEAAAVQQMDVLLTLHVAGSFDSFLASPSQFTTFGSQLASVLSIGSSQLNVMSATDGSVVITVVIVPPANSAGSYGGSFANVAATVNSPSFQVPGYSITGVDSLGVIVKQRATSGAGNPSDEEASTLVFREGVESYKGTVDVSISNQYIASWNDYKGLTWPNGFIDLGRGGTEYRGLLRFNNIYVPAGATLSEARITLWTKCWSGGSARVLGYYPRTYWNESSPDLSWRYSSTGVQWSIPGAKNDSYPIPAFNATVHCNGIDSFSVVLNPFIVGRWLTRPDLNYGLMLVLNDSTPATFMTVYSSDMTEVQYRPQLRLRYIPAPYDPADGVPSAPENVQLSVTSRTSLTVTWTAPQFFGGGGLTAYEVVWSSHPSFSAVSTATVEVIPGQSVPLRSFTIEGLPTGQPVYVAVQGVNNNGTSSKQLATPAFAVPASPPSVPQNVVFTILGPDSVSVSWDASADSGGANISSYTVAFALTSDFNSAQTVVLSPSVGRMMTTLTGLHFGTPYSIVVYASNAAFDGEVVELHDVVTAVVPPTAPNRPVVFVQSISELLVQWSAPDSDGGAPVSQYCVKHSSTADFSGVDTATICNPVGSSLSAVISGLAAGQCRFIAVAAASDAGQGVFASTSPASACTSHVTRQTVAVQDGFQGYTSTSAVSITTINGLEAWNSFNGLPFMPGSDNSTDASHSMSGILSLFDSDSSMSRLLIKFSNLESKVPSTAVVLSARLHLTFRYWSGPFQLRGQYLAANWSASGCCNTGYADRIGWRYRDGQRREWSGAGISGASDVSPVGDFFFDGFSVQTYGYATKVVELDNRVVQQWVSNPSANNGIVLMMGTPGRSTEVVVGGLKSLFPGTRPLLELDIQTVPAGEAVPVAPQPSGVTRFFSQPRDWYVDTLTGDDLTGSGLAGNPLATLAKARQFVLPNDTIWLNGGVHPGGFSLWWPNITLRSVPGTRASISSTRDSSVGITIQIRDTASRAALLDLDIAGSNHYGVLVDNVYGTRTGPTDVRIERCTVHDTGNTGIKVKSGAHRIRLVGNRVVRTGSRLKTYGHGIDVLGVDDAYIADNFVSDVPNNGIAVSAGANRAVVTRNFVRHTGNIGITLGWYQELDEMGLSSSFAATQSKIYMNTNSSVTNNIIVNTQGAGVGLYSARNALVAHNTLWFTSQSQMPCILINIVQVYVSYYVAPMTPCTNITINNNIVAKSAKARKDMMVQIRKLTDWTNSSRVVSALGGPLSMTHNVYAVQDVVGASPFRWGVGVMFEDETPGHANVGNLSMWQSFMGTDAGSAQVVDVALDADFCPLACSAAFGTASDSAVPFEDFATQPGGEPRTRNIGAVTDCAAAAAVIADAEADVAAVSGVVPLPPVFSYAGFPDWAMTVYASHNCTNRYVSPSGNDNNDGSFASPWKTIYRALSVYIQPPNWGAMPCDTVYLRAGTYNEQVVIRMPNITLANYPGERVYIRVPTTDSSIGSAVFLSPGGNSWNSPAEITLRGLDIAGGYYYAIMFNQVGGGHTAFWDAYRAYSGNPGRGYTLIEDCYLHDSGTSVIKMSPDAGHIVIRRTEIANSGLRAGGRRLSEVEDAVGEKAERFMVGRSLVDSTDIAIGTDPTDGTPSAAGASGGAVTDGQLAATAADSTLPAASNGNGIDSRQGSFITVEDSYFHDIRGVGILLGGGALNCTIRRNVLRNIGSIGIMVGSFDTEVQWMNVDVNPEFYQNIGAVVVNNIVSDAGGAGVGVYSARNALIAHNTLVRVARTMHAGILLNLAPELVSPWTTVVPTNRDISILNNVIVNHRDGVKFGMEARTVAIPASRMQPYPVAFTEPDGTCAAGPGAGAGTPAVVDPHEGQRAADGTCPDFPVNNAWHRDISTLPTHPMSNTWMASICGCLNFPCGGCPNLHPDFGSFGPTVYGIPFVDVNSTQERVPVNILEYPTESDYPGPFPIPPDAPIEGLTAATRTCTLNDCFGDRHVLVRDTSSCLLYELYHAQVPTSAGAPWSAGSTAVFNLTSNARRPLGWTSADASGNSIYAGLVKVAEVAAGEIKHAIRMTVQATQKGYINDLASHYAAYSTDPKLPPMGLRFRLKASFDCAALRPSARVICVALQTYGAVIMDNGADAYLSGEQNAAFDSAELADIGLIPFSEMEAVDSGPLCTTPDCSPPSVVPPAVIVPAVKAADFPTINMHGNVWHWDVFSYEAGRTLSFVNRDPSNFVYDNLAAWQTLAASNGAPVDSSVESNPQLNSWFEPSNDFVSASAAAFAVVPEVAEDFYRNPRTPGAAVIPGAIVSTPAEVLSGSSPLPGGWPAFAKMFAPRPHCESAPTSFAVVYVDAVSGNDTACYPNSVSTPLKTVSVALSLVAPNGVVYLRQGTYSTGGLVLSVPGVTLVAYQGELPSLRAPITLDRGSPLTIVPSANGVTLQGLEIRGGYGNALVINGASDVLVTNCTIRGAGVAGVVITGTLNTTLDGVIVRHSGQMNAPDGHGVVVRASMSTHIRASTIDTTRGYGVVVDEQSSQAVISRNLIVNTGGGVSFGPISQPMPDDDAVGCVSSVSNPTCARVTVAVMENNLVLNTRGAGVNLAGTVGVTVVHNSFVRAGLALGAGIQLSALQLWDSTTDAGVLLQNTNANVVNNLVFMAPLSAQPAVAVTSQNPWAGGAAVSGLAWDNSVVDYNLLSKDATPEPVLYNSSFYTFNALYRSAAGSGFGSLSVSSSDAYVYDSTMYPTRMSVSVWNTQHSVANFEGQPQLNNASVPSTTGAAAAGSASPAGCALLTEAVDFAYKARTCASASVGALEAAATVLPLPGYASVPLMRPAPGACLGYTNASTLCVAPKCYHAWQSNAPPTGMDYAAVYSKCLANGAMFSGAGSEWSRDVSKLPVHPLSESYVTSIGLGKGIHPDFGSQYGGDMMGFPTMVVSSSFPKSPVTFLFNTESDNVPYPVPFDGPQEGGECASNGDRHLLIVDKDACKIYELYQLYRFDPAYWSSAGAAGWAQSGAVFDTSTNGIRPNTQGWTSADAAGMSVFAGLVHWYEVAVLGEIRHAIRMTISKPHRGYVSPPATHLVGTDLDAGRPAMGQRFRLKASYDCTTLPTMEARVICVAMKKYGLIVADIGSDWFISGESHPGWNDANLDVLKTITSGNFEAVLTGGQLCTDAGCV